MGIIGFIPALSPNNDGNTNQQLVLGIFGVNYLHDISHILLGAILIYGGLVPANVFLVNKIMAVIFIVLFLASFIGPLADLVALNAADAILHLVSAALTGYLGFVAERGAPATAM